jgi:hypothetical protein
VDIATSNHVIARNNIGRFEAACKQAGEATVKELIDEGMKVSKAMAPVGHKYDPRTLPLKDSFFTEMRSRTSGVWGNFARHALPIEKGARPHPIFGNPALGFYWEAMRRRWIPAALYYHDPGAIDMVNHPGNRAQPFLRPAYEFVSAKAMQIARKHYRR